MLCINNCFGYDGVDAFDPAGSGALGFESAEVIAAGAIFSMSPERVIEQAPLLT